MPEAVTTKMEQRTVPTLTIDTGDSVETLGLPAEEKWGFRLTGGAEFGMPVTIFQVKEGSRAEIVGVKCGDSILRINGITTEGMSLKDAQRALEYAGDDLRLQVSSFQDDDNESPPKDVRDIVLAGKKKTPEPEPEPEPVLEPEKPRIRRIKSPEQPKQCWHPVMWPQLRTDEEEESYEGDKPHARIIRNVRRFLTTCKDSEERQKIIERMFLSLPTASKHKEHGPEEEEEERQKLAELRRLSLAMREPIDRQLRNMQKKLLAIANIPLVIQHAIEEVARVLEKFVPPEPEVEEPDTDESDYAVTVESLFDESEVLETISQYDYEDVEPEEDDEDEFDDVQVELSPEEKERIERMKNIEKVQKAWPWKDEERPIHKNCYLVPSSHELIEKRKKQLNKFLIPPFYKPPAGANMVEP